MEFLQQAMDHIGGNLLNIGDSLESRNAWLIGTFVLFIPLVIWGYSMFCTGQKALWVLRLVAVAVVSFGGSFLASRLLLTAIGVVFAILSGVVYIIGTLIYMEVLMIAFLIVCIMMAIAPKR